MTLPCGHTKAEHQENSFNVRQAARVDLSEYIERSIGHDPNVWAPAVGLMADMLACADPTESDRDYFTGEAKALSVDNAMALAVIAGHCVERGNIDETTVMRLSVDLGSISAGAIVLVVRQFLISDAITDQQLIHVLSTLHTPDYPALANLAVAACTTIEFDWAEMDRLARLATKLSAEQTAGGANGTGDPVPTTEEESTMDEQNLSQAQAEATEADPLAQDGFPLAAMTAEGAEGAEGDGQADVESGATVTVGTVSDEIPSGTTEDGREVAVTHTDDGPAETRTPAAEPYL